MSDDAARREPEIDNIFAPAPEAAEAPPPPAIAALRRRLRARSAAASSAPSAAEDAPGRGAFVAPPAVSARAAETTSAGVTASGDAPPARPRAAAAKEAARRAAAEAAAQARAETDAATARPAPEPAAPRADPAPVDAEAAPGAPAADAGSPSGADARPVTPRTGAARADAAPPAPPHRREAAPGPAATAVPRSSGGPAPTAEAEPAASPLGAIRPALRAAPADALPARTSDAPPPAAPGDARPPAPPASPPARSAPPPPPEPEARFAASRALLLGFLGVAVLLGGLVGWGAFANIAGAVIASGRVEVETRQQVVEHPDGGVVGDILARDGDVVDAGQVLLRLDDTLLRSEETILYDQYWELVSRRNRLEAEQFRAEEIRWDEALLARAAEDPDVDLMRRGQEALFDTRSRASVEQVDQLRERQRQIERQIEGAEAQISALDRQIDLIDRELEGQRRLLEQGLTQLNRVLSLERERARLDGRVGELVASIAEARGRLAEIEIQILQARTQRQEQAISELRDIQYQENQVREQLVQVRERLDRMEVRAPIAGTVFGSTVFARQSVVQPGEPILYIVPTDTEFVITAQVEPINIDQVYIGQPATLRFSAFSARNTPEIDGIVVKVSADALTDEQRGYSYYQAEIALAPGEESKLEGLTLVPGMPVEAYIRTDERTPLNYLVKPLSDYFSRSMREE